MLKWVLLKLLLIGALLFVVAGGVMPMRHIGMMDSVTVTGAGIVGYLLALLCWVVGGLFLLSRKEAALYRFLYLFAIGSLFMTVPFLVKS